MTSLRTIVVSSVLLAACNQGAPTPAKPAAAASDATPVPAKPAGSMPENALPAGDPHAVPLPTKDEVAVGDMVPSAGGTLDAMIDGKPAHFVRLPPGQNRAVVLPDGGVGRVSLAGSEDESGLPHLRILIEGVRPDQATYPLVIGASPGAEKAPSLTVRYEVNENRIYVLDPAKGADVQVTLEGWEGKTLRGRFAGKLAPTAAGLGAPIPISGSFSVGLGVQGIEPGPAVPAKTAGDAAPTKSH